MEIWQSITDSLKNLSLSWNQPENLSTQPQNQLVLPSRESMDDNQYSIKKTKLSKEKNVLKLDMMRRPDYPNENAPCNNNYRKRSVEARQDGGTRSGPLQELNGWVGIGNGNQQQDRGLASNIFQLNYNDIQSSFILQQQNSVFATPYYSDERRIYQDIILAQAQIKEAHNIYREIIDQLNHIYKRYDPGQKEIKMASALLRENIELLEEANISVASFDPSEFMGQLVNSRRAQRMNAKLKAIRFRVQCNRGRIRANFHTIAISVENMKKKYETREYAKQVFSTEKVAVHIFSFLDVKELGRNVIPVCRDFRFAIEKYDCMILGIRSVDDRWRFWQSNFEKRGIVHPTGDDFVQQLSRAIACPPACAKEMKRDITRTTFARKQSVYNNGIVEKFSRIGSARSNQMEVDASSKETLQNTLAGILNASVLLHEDTGYRHGMTCVASTIMTCLDNRDYHSFIAFNAIEQQYQLAEACRPDLESGKAWYRILDRLITTNLPKLSNTLKANGIRSEMFATGWLMTLFGHDTSIHPEVQAHIMDKFIADGWKGYFAFILGLLESIEFDLIGKPMGQILKTLNRVGTHLSQEALPQVFARGFDLIVPDIETLTRHEK